MGIVIQAGHASNCAKDDGRDGLGVQTSQRDRQARRSIDLSQDLRAGIRRGELDLNYQTQVEIDTGRIVGLEALVRWKHPILGEIQPSNFVSMAERKGVIQALGHWVLDRACRQINEWEDEGLVVPRLAINVSEAQMRRPGDFEREVTESFGRWNIRPHAIELELTETVLMDVSQRQADALERLRGLGATIAIDDFGTGYSSLKYLAAYPVQRLKIAQELVVGITHDSRSAVIVRSAARLAHELGIECLAEGVENAGQAQLLIELGCAYAQGYYFSRPMPAGNVAAMLAATTASIAVPFREVSTG